MSTDPKDRQDALKRLNHVRISLIDTILLSAVDRESHIDLNLANDPSEQQLLKNFIRGLSVIYYFSFLQSNLVESQWEEIKSPKGSQRGLFKKVDWNKFDALKYARDCFAHNWDGRIFPASQENTKHFLSIFLHLPDPKFISLDNDKIVLNDDATFECLQVVKTVIEEGDIAV